MRFVGGAFRRANAERGSFRDYLKTALSNLINDYRRQRQDWHAPLAPEGPEPAAPSDSSVNSGVDFLVTWRAEILERTWQALLQAHPTIAPRLLSTES